MSEFLSLTNIEKRFPIPGKEDYIAVTDVNLEIKKMRSFRLLGTVDVVSLLYSI